MEQEKLNLLQYITKLKSRAKTNAPADLNEIYNRIWNGTLSSHVSGKYTDRDLFYSSYIQTYIERDVKYIADIEDTVLFGDFIRSATYRAGQMLNVVDYTQT